MTDPTRPARRTDHPVWLNPDWDTRHRDHRQACQDLLDAGTRPHFAFIGDSITEGWLLEPRGLAQWQQHFAERSLNLGLGGDSTYHLLWRLEDNELLRQLAPPCVVCLIGTNNIGNDEQGAEDVARGVVAVLKACREHFPESALRAIAILPRGREADHPYRVIAAEANRQVAAFCAAENIAYRDFADCFVDSDSGSIPETLMADELHLSPEAYARWAEALVPWLDN